MWRRPAEACATNTRQRWRRLQRPAGGFSRRSGRRSQRKWLLLNGHFEVEEVLAGRGVFYTRDVQSRAGSGLSLKIKEAVNGRAGRDHAGRESAAFAFAGRQRTFFLCAR